MDTIDVQVMRSHIARGLTLAGELAEHFRRGAVFADAFNCYLRIHSHLGRTWTNAHAESTVIGWPSSRELRMDVFHEFIMPALRNAEALDAERHWRTADAVMLGYADKEAMTVARHAKQHRGAATRQSEPQEWARRAWELNYADACDAQVAIYRAALTRKPWVREDQMEASVFCAAQCGRKVTVLRKDAHLLPADWTCPACEQDALDRQVESWAREHSEKVTSW